MKKNVGFKIMDNGTNKNFSPIFKNSELNMKLNIYCGITNKNKTKYCEEVILERVTKDIEEIQKKINRR